MTSYLGMVGSQLKKHSDVYLGTLTCGSATMTCTDAFLSSKRLALFQKMSENIKELKVDTGVLVNQCEDLDVRTCRFRDAQDGNQTAQRMTANPDSTKVTPYMLICCVNDKTVSEHDTLA